MRYITLALAFLTPIILVAQKNFRPGYIVTLKSDTIRGFIDYKDWHLSPKSISFKSTNDNGIPKEYSVNDLGFFEVTGSEAYRRGVVTISLHPVKLSDINGRDTSWKIDTVFLKEIYSGAVVSLLSYTDKLKERFYILKKGQQQPAELLMREYLQEGSLSLINESTYKVQLKNLLYANGTYNDELGEQIQGTAYEQRDLKRTISLVNKASNIAQDEEKDARTSYWFAGVGLQRDKVTFRGDQQMARHPNSSKSTLLPRISAGVDLSANPEVGRTFFRAEAAFQVNQSIVTTSLPENVKAVYELSASTVSLQAQVNHALYNSLKLKVPLGAGVAYNFSSYSKNQYKKVYDNGTESNHVENWLNLKKGTATFFGRASVVFNDKIEASFIYSPSVRLTKTIVYGVSRSNMGLQVYYLFRKKK